MKKYLYIGSFGFLGAIVRFLIKNANITDLNKVFPVNTLLINVTGSFLLAFVMALTLEVVQVKEELKLGITTGFIGTYTTFSSYCKDAVSLITKGNYFLSIAYVLLSVILSFAAIYIAVTLANRLTKRMEAEQESEEVV